LIEKFGQLAVTGYVHTPKSVNDQEGVLFKCRWASKALEQFVQL